MSSYEDHVIIVYKVQVAHHLRNILRRAANENVSQGRELQILFLELEVVSRFSEETLRKYVLELNEQHFQANTVDYSILCWLTLP